MLHAQINTHADHVFKRRSLGNQNDFRGKESLNGWRNHRFVGFAWQRVELGKTCDCSGGFLASV